MLIIVVEIFWKHSKIPTGRYYLNRVFCILKMFKNCKVQNCIFYLIRNFLIKINLTIVRIPLKCDKKWIVQQVGKRNILTKYFIKKCRILRFKMFKKNATQTECIFCLLRNLLKNQSENTTNMCSKMDREICQQQKYFEIKKYVKMQKNVRKEKCSYRTSVFFFALQLTL